MEQPTWDANDFSHPHSALGAMAWLMAHAEYHSRWNCHDVNTDIVPPVVLGQFQLYHTEAGEPVGFATWAFVSEEVKDALINRSRPMQFDDWRSGDLLMFNDFVAPFGHGRWMVNHLRGGRFADRNGFSLGRSLDGAIRKIYAWRGKNLRHAPEQGRDHHLRDDPGTPNFGEASPKTHALA